MIRFWFSFFSIKAPYYIVYMLQQVEYNISGFASWIRFLPPLSMTQKRKKLVYTRVSSMLLIFSQMGWTLGYFLIIVSVLSANLWIILLALLVFPLFPLAAALTPTIPGSIIKKLLVKRVITNAAFVYQKTPATKIAVLGSYGKTTTKEILHVLLSEKYDVSSTPGNKNVITSLAKLALEAGFASKDVIIVEFGEYRKGDIAQMAELVAPDYAIITGYAPNHLDSYGTEQDLKNDLASITQYVNSENIVSSAEVAKILKISNSTTYSEQKVSGWKIEDVAVSINGTSFTMTKNTSIHSIHIAMIGAHLVPVLAMSIALSVELFGLSWKQVQTGLSKLKPYPHRMSPYQCNGAWVIDDTYNGNIEGIRAGLRLLKDLEATRKIYVTPGLVEQGSESQAVHEEIAKLITDAAPDRVVLMHNTSTKIINRTLQLLDYKGEVTIEKNPLEFYKNLEHFVASGDVVLMQNDWNDNYN